MLKINQSQSRLLLSQLTCFDLSGSCTTYLIKPDVMCLLSNKSSYKTSTYKSETQTVSAYDTIFNKCHMMILRMKTFSILILKYYYLLQTTMQNNAIRGKNKIILMSKTAYFDSPTWSSVICTVGRLFILSRSAGGGPVFSNWFNN